MAQQEHGLVNGQRRRRRANKKNVWLELWFHCREILARHVASRLDLAILAGVEGSPVWLDPGLANLASPMGSPS